MRIVRSRPVVTSSSLLPVMTVEPATGRTSAAAPTTEARGDTSVFSATATARPLMPALLTPNSRRSAAGALLQTIAEQEAAGKLNANHAALLRQIANRPATTEQQLRFLAEGITHLGKDYNWGSQGPDQFDCSGLTLYISRHVLGIELPDTAANQMATLPQKVERAKLQPGDLVFFGSLRRITHVGIYLGDNQMLEAGGEGQVPTDKGRVRIRSVRKDYAGARRVVQDSPAARQ